MKIGKKLEKKISNDECDSALDVLERLKETKMTLEVLQVGKESRGEMTNTYQPEITDMLFCRNSILLIRRKKIV